MPKKLTCQEALLKVQKRLPEITGIVESTYTNTQNFVTFIDRDYGEFEGVVSHLIYKGSGHPTRVAKNRRDKTITPMGVIKNRISKSHGDLVTLKEGTFVSINSIATFIDKDFGEWDATVKSVAKGSRHPSRHLKSKTFDLDTVNRKIFEAHGDVVKLKESSYTKAGALATFIDKDFGEWECTAILVYRGHGHPHRADLAHRTSLEKINERLLKVHKGMVSIVESSYVMVARKAIFIDAELGQFECLVNSVLKGVSHPGRQIEKSEKTCLSRYGAKNASQVPELALKGARKLNERFLKTHWETGEELVCQASWEARVVDYLNSLKVKFIWQPTAFPMPDGQTYRPDFFDSDRKVWVEIKGLIRPKFVIKWDWFLTQFPNAELWDKKKLKELGIL